MQGYLTSVGAAIFVLFVWNFQPILMEKCSPILDTIANKATKALSRI